MLPKVLKSCPKSNKLPNLVTLAIYHLLTKSNRFVVVLKVAFTLGQNMPRKMVVFKMKKTFFIYQIAKSTAYYAA